MTLSAASPITCFAEEHDLFRKGIREFVAREVAPFTDEWERAELFPREMFKRLGQLGYLGMRYPEDLGGGGGDYWYTVVFAEELTRSGSAGFNMAMMVQAEMAVAVINDIGTTAQKAEFLGPAIRGERIAALGISEPNAGSDVASIRTTARRVGDDFVINGAKTFITNGTRADFITLAVRTGGEGYGGVSLILFPTDARGFRVNRKLKKMGNHASDTAEISFEDCRVPARNLLGEENHGFYYIMMNFQGERLIAAVAGVQAAQNGEMAIHVVDRCLQAHGGYGYTDEFKISRAYRDVRLLTIGGGTSEVMKEIIAKRMGIG
jgi:citronellyl-CoA dehydrogenase